MPEPHQRPTGSPALRPLIITAAFNTAIAILLSTMVLQQQAFVHVLVISQVMGLSICAWMVAAKRYGSGKPPLVMTAAATVGMGAGVLSGSLLSWCVMTIVFGTDFRLFLKDVFIYTLVFGVVFGIPISQFFASRARILASEQRIQREKIKRLTLEKEAAMMALKITQAQIEPHFLFNTLSNIISLLDMDADKAKKMLVDLNDFLRISLQRTRQEMVTLDQEIELITCYLDIFKIRMGQRLGYEIRVDDDLRHLPFPPMLLQPLVENAVKHGLAPKPEGGRIAIDGRRSDGCLKIVVSDTGVGFEGHPGGDGVGLNNISTRLETIYGPQARLTVTENPPGGVSVKIEVPL